MQIGVYGSGYLGTVISACLADFGTPVSCCHPDRSRMVEMAQGNIPFFEKNLKEIIRRNVRAGRLAYSTDIESFARKTQVIFLAEDKPDSLGDVAMRIARLAAKPPILTIGGHGGGPRKGHQRRRTAGHHRFAANVFHRRLCGRGFQLA
jgi:UDPglucose 6-dehydrogenase